MMIRCWAVILSVVSISMFPACKNSRKSNQVSTPASQDLRDEPVGVLVYDRKSDMPKCEDSTRDRLVYVRATKLFYNCTAKGWSEIEGPKVVVNTPIPSDKVQESWADSWRQVWRRNVASTAFILVRYTGATCSFLESGSGFVVGKDLVATNGHVVQATQVDPTCGAMTLTQVLIWFAVDSRGDTLHNERNADVSVVTQIDRSVASQTDIAVISAPTLARTPVTVSSRDPSPDKLQEGGVRLAEEVLQIGYSGGSTFAHFALGRINAIQKVSSSSRGFLASFVADGLIASGTTVYEYDLVSGGGASGSPIFDQNGEVIAINFAGNTKDADTEFGYGVIAKGLRDLLASPRQWQSISGSL